MLIAMFILLLPNITLLEGTVLLPEDLTEAVGVSLNHLEQMTK